MSTAVPAREVVPNWVAMLCVSRVFQTPESCFSLFRHCRHLLGEDKQCLFYDIVYCCRIVFGFESSEYRFERILWVHIVQNEVLRHRTGTMLHLPQHKFIMFVVVSHSIDANCQQMGVMSLLTSFSGWAAPCASVGPRSGRKTMCRAGCRGALHRGENFEI